MTANRRAWIGAAALAGVTLLALSWLLLLSPRLAGIERHHAARDTAEERNEELRSEIAVLAADFERLDELAAELAALRTQFPTAIELPEFTRGLAGMVEATGAKVRSVTVGSSQAVTTVPDLPAAPDGTPAPALPEPPPGLYAVPITLTVEGTFEQAQQYASALQGQDQRLFLLSRLSWTRADEDGRAAFAINGHTYVLAPDGVTAGGSER